MYAVEHATVNCHLCCILVWYVWFCDIGTKYAINYI